MIRDRTDVKGQLDSAENRVATLASADARKNLFLGTLAHELRSPLSPLLNAIELIRLGTARQEDVTGPLRVIERQVASIERLVEDLLDVTRIGAGRCSCTSGRCASTRCYGWPPTRCGRACADRRSASTCCCCPPRCASRPTPTGCSRSSSTCSRTPASTRRRAAASGSRRPSRGRRRWSRVEDSGIGIGAEMLPRIFELFTQEESARGMAEGGLGLGLPLVRELVTLHGGTVQVRRRGPRQGGRVRRATAAAAARGE